MKMLRSPKPPLSLRARGVQLLSQREHSVSELRQKLQRHARLLEAAPTFTEAGDEGCDDGEEQAGQHHSAEGVDGRSTVHRPDSVVPAQTVPVPIGFDAAEAVADALVWLQAQGYLSDTRFTQSRVHVRAARFGNLRIRQELAQHQVVLTPEAAQALRDSEFERALAVFQRKFGNVPTSNASETAKQARFLTQRGFSSDVVRQVLRAIAKVAAAKP